MSLSHIAKVRKGETKHWWQDKRDEVERELSVTPWRDHVIIMVSTKAGFDVNLDVSMQVGVGDGLDALITELIRCREILTEKKEG